MTIWLKMSRMFRTALPRQFEDVRRDVHQTTPPTEHKRRSSIGLLGVLVLVLIALHVIVWGVDQYYMAFWSGNGTLETNFTVTAANTGCPIPNALIEIEAGGPYFEESVAQSFQVAMDDRGAASKVCPNCWTSGKLSYFGFTQTHHIRPPEWRFRATAKGFEPSEWQSIQDPAYRRRTHRVAPGHYRLDVPIELSTP